MDSISLPFQELGPLTGMGFFFSTEDHNVASTRVMNTKPSLVWDRGPRFLKAGFDLIIGPDRGMPGRVGEKETGVYMGSR
jgi:hypothetical protein